MPLPWLETSDMPLSNNVCLHLTFLSAHSICLMLFINLNLSPMIMFMYDNWPCLNVMDIIGALVQCLHFFSIDYMYEPIPTLCYVMHMYIYTFVLCLSKE